MQSYRLKDCRRRGWDSDNDQCGTSCNCAADHGGGWWFRWCTGAGLNYNGNAIWNLVHDILTSRMLLTVD